MKNIINKNIRNSFIIVILLTVFCFALTGCKKLNKIEQNKKDGNTIVVKYDANGGTYLNRRGITVIDMFNPADYSKDSSGTVHIKLLDPCDEKRPSGTTDGIFITRTDYFLVGWYKNREIKKNSDGKVINDNNETLVLINDEYFLESDNTVASTPAYTYSGYWNFDTDTIDFTSDMKEFEMTLYACWCKNFEFKYYAKTGVNWELVGSNVFDYVTTNSNVKYADKDTIWTPTWVDGCMNYTFKYSSGSNYNFPKVSGYTFKKAYTDESLTQEIGAEYEHPGYINYETGEAVNSVQNIYIELEKGNYYHISEANQFVKNVDLNGIYIIENDLDFAGLDWPSAFSLSTFEGKICTKDNNQYKMSNITVNHSNQSAKVGGVFGTIGDNAIIENITFEDAILDISYAGLRNRNTNFGLLAGVINDKATLNNINLSGTIKFGGMSLGDNYSINLVGNGDTTKVTVLSDIHVIVYGTLSGSEYSYTIDPDNVTIDENGNITLLFKTGIKKSASEYVIK